MAHGHSRNYTTLTDATGFAYLAVVIDLYSRRVVGWFTDVLAKIADIPQSRLHELLPWHWKES